MFLALDAPHGPLTGPGGRKRRRLARWPAPASKALAPRTGSGAPQHAAPPYLHADLELKQRALDRTAPPRTRRGRYTAKDELLAFLEAL